ncbi:CCR4-NOT transcription complex subunit 7 [Colletotrichum orbiculare MAFF 240422]|uniref:poly(A)-specific ribonuclease n=1 Tax=Colletotrichum orbiculare (strain 104-T / ATCC 96160 / CBS 514.97 / LARS 414 / MAFF 240422) TaxID=1213857 RepID=N4URN7_COLOR|nr:CCR4-NOT transcription complex subunit 7 [Colletotrichum orbiculare MAFF 240422]
MPPQPNRFAGPNTISPYHQQFPSHGAQGHGASHGPPLGGNSYLNTNAQISPFSANGNVLGGTPGLNGGFSLGGDNNSLGSHAARMSFHGANLQPQQHGQPQHGFSLDYGASQPRSAQNKGKIREVWKHNLHEEMAVLRDLVEKYPYIAMDTEFPGVVSRPMGSFRGKSDYHYQCLRTNVDMLKVIQIGLTLFNEDGKTPNSTQDNDLGPAAKRAAAQGPFAWQFNFKFSLEDDMYNEKSIDSLRSANIDFGLLARDGIDPHEFASLLIPSGLVCFESVKWISFHGGYDFGYLTKLLTCQDLPNDESDFDQIMRLYFPSAYDVKHLMKHAIRLHSSGLLTPNDPNSADILQKFEHKSGLDNIAESLKIKRQGPAHQAGSDSLLTGKVFFQMRDKIYNGDIPEEHVGKVWGLGIPELLLLERMPFGNNAGNQDGSHGQQNGQQNGGPSTPNTASVGLVSTPAAQSHNTNGLSLGGPMTPGGGGGVFGSFAFPGGGGGGR